MRLLLKSVLALTVCVVISSAWIWVQQATAKRSLAVRHDPLKSSPAIDHVAKGDKLTLIGTTAVPAVLASC